MIIALPGDGFGEAGVSQGGRLIHDLFVFELKALGVFGRGQTPVIGVFKRALTAFEELFPLLVDSGRGLGLARLFQGSLYRPVFKIELTVLAQDG